MQTEPHKTARCREQRDPNIEAKTRDVPPSRERPSLRLGGDGDHAPRPASETGLPGRRRRARPRAREARDALAPCLDRPAGRRGDLPCGRDVQESNHAGFLGITGGKYPRGDLTRVMPGDVSVHASAETRRYLATIPGRFEFVSAPRHGSWLNLVEGFFSRMARQMLRGVRVFSKDELKERILRHLGGEHRVGRLRAGVGPVGHRPDSRGARRRHSSPG